VDFVGEILSGHLVDADGLTEAGVDSRLTHPQQVLVEVRVIESFRGPQKAGDIIHLRTGLGGGDCGYRFKLGRKYLIDATERNGSLYTGICSLTAPVEESEIEIDSLRKLASGLRIPDVVGILYKVSTTAEDWQQEPLPDVEISLSGKKGNATYRVSTNMNGQFTFPRIPDGAYRVSLKLPYNLSPALTNLGRTTDQDEIPKLVVHTESLGSAACHVEIFVDSAASISGVVTANGNVSPDGWVNADTVINGEPWNTISSTIPSSKGDFRLAHLPPGRYQIQFKSRTGFVKGDPQIIELKEGERRSGVILTAK
jgi:hypothetical protein